MKLLALSSILFFALYMVASEQQYKLEYLHLKNGGKVVRLVKLVDHPLYCSVRNDGHTSNFTVTKKLSRWYKIYSKDFKVVCSELLPRK